MPNGKRRPTASEAASYRNRGEVVPQYIYVDTSSSYGDSSSSTSCGSSGSSSSSSSDSGSSSSSCDAGV